MKFVGFNFTKINIERMSGEIKDLKINNNIDISDVKKTKPELVHSKEEFIEIKFDYNINYEPNIAKISLAGTVLLMVDSKVAKEFQKAWKTKKLPDEHKITIFNVILKKTNLKAMQLEDEMNLPLHVPMPTVKETQTNN